jgi:hypothetical protein
MTCTGSMPGKPANVAGQRRTLLDRDAMITIGLCYRHIICGFGIGNDEILGRAVNVCGSTVDFYRRILPRIRHFDRGLLPCRSHIGGDSRRGPRTVATTRQCRRQYSNHRQ